MSLINELMIEMRHPSQLPLEELKPQVDGGASDPPELRVRPLPYATTARTRLRFSLSLLPSRRISPETPAALPLWCAQALQAAAKNI